jgi:molybdate transport system substrate-binding protein
MQCNISGNQSERLANIHRQTISTLLLAREKTSMKKLSTKKLSLKKRLHPLQYLVLGFFALQAHAEEITVAVAANFSAAMNRITPAFEKASGHKLVLAFGASGKFYAQIKNGAPFQVFFSADQSTPAALEKDGLAVPDTRFTYAEGALALWSAKTGFIDAEASALKEGKFNKLALANPKLAPYGAAAVEILQHLGLEQKTQAQWILGENIAQAYQFISTGNADLGFVALAQLMDQGPVQGSVWIVPSELHSPILQDAVLLRKGETSQGARELLRFMQEPQALDIIRSYGYKTKP